MRTAASSETTESRPARVLLWARMTSHFREMLRVVRVLARTADYEPVMLFDYPYFGHESEQAQCDREGIAWILQSSRQFIHGPPCPQKGYYGRGAATLCHVAAGAARRSFLARGVRALRYLNARYVLGTYGSVRARLLPRWTALRGQRHHLRQAHRPRNRRPAAPRAAGRQRGISDRGPRQGGARTRRPDRCHPVHDLQRGRTCRVVFRRARTRPTRLGTARRRPSSPAGSTVTAAAT